LACLPRSVLDELAKRYGEDIEGKIAEAVEDVREMISRFVWAGMYSFADRLANAVGKEIVSATLYEALRISKSTRDSGGTLDENVRPHVAKESSVKLLLDILDLDLVSGLELVRRIAILSLAWRG